MSHSSYLRTNRLPDVIAAIQSMAMNERSSLTCKQWAEITSGDEGKEAHWRTVLDDHSELFRKSPNYDDHYALIWRRALPRRYFRPEGRMLSQIEFKALPPDQQKLVSRPPVPEDQVKTLVDIAISLQASQHDQHRDRRWWVPLVLSFAGSVLGAIIGVGGVVLGVG